MWVKPQTGLWLKLKSWKSIIWQNIFCRKKTHRHMKIINNQFLHITIKIWDWWRAKLIPTFSPFSTFTNQSWFSPGSSSEYKKWALLRINRLIDITEKGLILPKQQLEDKLQDKMQWIQCFQLQSLCEMLIRIKEMGAKGMISSMYTILLKLDDSVFGGKITKWSEDCKIPITQEDWTNINN